MLISEREKEIYLHGFREGFQADKDLETKVSELEAEWEKEKQTEEMSDERFCEIARDIVRLLTVLRR